MTSGWAGGVGRSSVNAHEWNWFHPSFITEVDKEPIGKCFLCCIWECWCSLYYVITIIVVVLLNCDMFISWFRVDRGCRVRYAQVVTSMRAWVSSKRCFCVASAAVVVCPERCFRGEARAAVGSPQKIAAQPLSNTAVSGASRMVWRTWKIEW